MRKIFNIAFILLCIIKPLHAQTGWLPPVTFPANSNFCDNASWKLVLFDNFNGNQLDTGKWITHFSWDHMPGGDNDNFDGARKSGGVSLEENSWNNVVLDQNVVVSNGTCKLVVKNEPVNWHCSSCPDENGRYCCAMEY